MRLARRLILVGLIPAFFAACSDSDVVGPDLLDASNAVASFHLADDPDPADGEVSCHIGRAQGVAGTVRVLLTSTSINLADTGELSCDGAKRDATVLEASVDGILTADALVATTFGQGNETHSEAETANLDLNVAGFNITASLLRAWAHAECIPHLRFDGDSEVLDLRVNGVSVAVTGEANLRIDLAPGVYLVINEQKRAVKANTITVVALRVVADGIANIAISSAKAGAICAK